MAVKNRVSASSSGVSFMPTTYGSPQHPSLTSGFLSAPSTTTTTIGTRTKATLKTSNAPPPPKIYEPLKSVAFNRRAKPSTLAIGDTPPRRRALAAPDDAAHHRALVKMRPEEMAQLQEWMAGVTDTPEMLCDKLEKNARDQKDRMKKLNDSISQLTADMKNFRSAKEDWDDMVAMSSKMVKRKREATRDAYDRITDANQQIGRELTKNFPYVPYEMLVDHQYAVSFPRWFRN